MFPAAQLQFRVYFLQQSKVYHFDHWFSAVSLECPLYQDLRLHQVC